MKSNINIILLLIIPIISFSQTENLSEKNKFTIKTNIGLNISRLKNDSIEFEPGKKPFVGITGNYNISGRFSLSGVVNYSVKGSNSISPYLKIENQYLNLAISPRFEIFQDFYFRAGLSYLNIIKSNKIILSEFGQEKINISGYNSELNFFTGIEFLLQENINLIINYTIPTNNTYSSCFQIGLNIALNNRVEKRPNYRKMKSEASKTQIKQLKEGVLLVRLKTAESTINALREVGKNEEADKVKLKQETENKKIINAFKNNFDFCDVRFFFSNNSDKVRLKQFENIFLNDSLEVDPSIKLEPDISFFIAEFGYIGQDTMKYYSHHSYKPGKDYGVEGVLHYYTPSSDINFYALRILDRNFVQLNKPFPYYTRAIYKTVRKHPEQLLFIPPVYLATLTWTYNHTVADLNRKLERYYRRRM